MDRINKLDASISEFYDALQRLEGVSVILDKDDDAQMIFESLNSTGQDLTDVDLNHIIKNTIKVLDKAIEEGGTTIRSYTSEEGVTGLFQNNLNVYQRENEKCHVCGNTIIKIRVGGRGTYYCPKCQKEKKSI